MNISARDEATLGNPLEQLDLAHLQQRTSMKWRTYPSDVLPLWVAEMDVQLAPPIEEALIEAIRIGDTGYPFGTGYAEAYATFASQRWGWNDFPVDQTAIVPDVMMGIVEVLRLVTNPGDIVVVNSPVYAPFYAFVTHDNRRIEEAPLDQNGRIDLESLEEAFKSAKTQGLNCAYLLCNPHNPTGTVHTVTELTAVAELSLRYGVRVVSDEIHGPLVLAGARFIPYLTVPGSENAFALMSASKAWNLAGLKAALAVAGSEAAPDLKRMPEEVSHGPSHLGLIAHTTALLHGQEWLDGLLRGLDLNRTLLGQLISRHLPEVGYKKPEGTYLAWLDCKYLSPDPEPDTEQLAVVSDIAGPARFFLDQARVALSSGHVFGRGGSNFVRLNFATSQNNLAEAIRRMGTVRP